MRMLQAGEHIHCLDLLKVGFSLMDGGSSHDCAILLEIWSDGALLQTSQPILPYSTITIESIANGIEGKVLSCEKDSYGYLVQVAMRQSAWFPEVYTPPHILWTEH